MGRDFYAVEYDNEIKYGEGLTIQKNVFEMVKENNMGGILLLLQHKPVFTIGSKGGWENLLTPIEHLKEQGIEIFETNRGGNITYHGHGQLVAYPIFNLKALKKDTHWYLRQLEEVIIRTLETFDIKAGRKEKYTGVWVEDKKIAAIGVHVKRWITMHGFAFNLTVNKAHFRLINPCGIKEYDIASLDDYIESVVYSDVVKEVKKQFERIFNIEFKKILL